MRPLKLTLEGFHSYRDRTDLDLSGVRQVAVWGSTGSGKSSLFDAMRFALFGTYRTADIDEVVCHGTQRASVCLRYEFDGQVYEQERTRHLGSKTVAYLRRVHGDQVENIAGPSTQQVTKAVTDLLGCNAATFEATVLIPQGLSGIFTQQATAAERRRILSDILELNHIDVLYRTVKERLRQKRQAASALQGQIDAYRASLPDEQSLHARQGELNQQLQQVNQQLQLIEYDRQAYQAYEAYVQRLQELNRTLRNESQYAQQLAQAQQRLASLQDQQRQIEDQLAHMADHTTDIEELHAWLTDLRDRREDLEGQIAQLGVACEHYAAEIDTAQADRHRLVAAQDCPLCGTHLDPESAQRIQTDLETRASLLQANLVEARQHIQRLQASRANIDAQIGQTQQTIHQYLQESSVIQELQRKVAGVQALQQEVTRSIQATQQRLDEIADAQAERAQLETQIAQLVIPLRDQVQDLDEQQLQAQASQIQQQLGGIQQQLDDAQRVKNQIDQTHQQLQQLQDEMRLYEIVSEVVAPTGLPTALMDTYVHQAMVVANSILADLGLPYQIQLRTSRPGADGHPIDCFDLSIQTATGERSYNSFSGGERFQLDLAIRMALTRLLQARSQHAIPTLIMDEGWGQFDEESVQVLADVCNRISTDFGFEFFATITHTPQVKEMFNHLILVTKDTDGYSHAQLVEAA